MPALRDDAGTGLVTFIRRFELALVFLQQRIQACEWAVSGRCGSVVTLIADAANVVHVSSMLVVVTVKA